jgi:hypothetical protein
MNGAASMMSSRRVVSAAAMRRRSALVMVKRPARSDWPNVPVMPVKR